MIPTCWKQASVSLGICALALIMGSGAALADGKNNGVYGLRFDGTLDSAPSCTFGDILFVFIEELDSVLMWESDALSVQVTIDEICFDNLTFSATFEYSMDTPDTDYLSGEIAVVTLSGASSGEDVVASTTDNRLFDGSRILRVRRDQIRVAGGATITTLFSQPNALSVELIDPPNLPPVAVPDTVSTLVNRDLPIQPLVNDSDPNGDTLSIGAFTQPAAGSLARSGETLVYTPIPDMTTSTTFNYLATDGVLNSEIVAVSVTVIERKTDLIFEEDNE